MNELREISTLLFIINLLTMVGVVLVIGIAPVITRKSLLFGVRIPEEVTQKPAVVVLKKNYIKVMTIGGIMALVLLIVQYLLFPDWSLLMMLYLPLLLIALQFTVFVSSWKRAVELKAKNNWTVPMTTTVDTSSAVQRERFWGFSKGWYIVSALIVVVVIILSIMKYPLLPAQIPTHWGFDMKPDAWADKSLWSVLLIPIVALIFMVVMMFSNIVVYRMKLQVSAEHPELSYAQHRIYRRMTSEAIGVMTITLISFSSLLQLMAVDILTPPTEVMVVATVLMILASCVPFTYVYIKAGQGGCKLKPVIDEGDMKNANSITKATTKFNRGDDRFWKLGMFYYNEEDPAMLVEDRFGINAGFNYARTSSKLVTTVLIMITLAVYIVTTIMFIKM